MAGKGKHFLDNLYRQRIGQSACNAELNGKSSKEVAEAKAANPVLNKSAELSGQSRSTFLMAFSPDGTVIASTHGDHSVRITEVKTGKCLHILTGHPRTPWCIAFHPTSNDILASGCLGGEVRIWDLRGGGTEVWKSEKGYVISSICFHPAGQVLVIATTNEVLFWDWTRPEPFARCKCNSDYERVRWVKFDPLGQYLLTGIANGAVVQREEVGNVNSTGDSRDIDERRHLRERYRSIVNHINHVSVYQREHLRRQYQTTRFPVRGPQEMPVPPPSIGLEGLSVSGPHEVDVDIVQPSSPVQLEALHDARMYAARITREANQSLLSPEGQSEPARSAGADQSSLPLANQPPPEITLSRPPPDYSALSLHSLARQELNNNSLRGLNAVSTVRGEETHRQPLYIATLSDSNSEDSRPFTGTRPDHDEDSNASDYSPSSGLRLLAEASGAVSHDQDGRMSGTGDTVNPGFSLSGEIGDAVNHGLRVRSPSEGVSDMETDSMLQSLLSVNTESSPQMASGESVPVTVAVSRTNSNTFTPITLNSVSPSTLNSSDTESSSASEGAVIQVSASVVPTRLSTNVVPSESVSPSIANTTTTDNRFIPLSETLPPPQNSLLRFHLTAASESSSSVPEVSAESTSSSDELVSMETTSACSNSDDTSGLSLSERRENPNNNNNNDSNSSVSSTSDSSSASSGSTDRPWTLHPVDLDESHRCEYSRYRGTSRGPFSPFPCSVRGHSSQGHANVHSSEHSDRVNSRNSGIPSLAEACQHSQLTHRLREARDLLQRANSRTTPSTGLAGRQSESRPNATTSNRLSGRSNRIVHEGDLDRLNRDNNNGGSVLSNHGNSAEFSWEPRLHFNSARLPLSSNQNIRGLQLRSGLHDPGTTAGGSLLSWTSGIESDSSIHQNTSSSGLNLRQRAQVEVRNRANMNLERQMNALNQLDHRVSEIQRNLNERLRSLREERRHEAPHAQRHISTSRLRPVERMREYHDHLRSRLEDIRQRYLHQRSAHVSAYEMNDMTVRAENTITHAERELRGMREELSRIQSRAGQQQEWLARVQDRQRQLHHEIQNMREEMIRRRQQQRERDRTWHTLQRRHLHPHYAISIVDDSLNNQMDGLQAAINRAIAGAFIGSGEAAVANNIVDLTHRIQRWDFSQCRIPDITCAELNVVVPHCKLHNDASCDISQNGQRLATFVPTHNGFPDDTVLAVFSLETSTLGQCLFTKSFGPNAISVSISPLNNFVLVGLAAKRLAWVFTPNQMVGQIYELKSALAGEASMQHVADVMHPCEMDLRTHVSVNSARWLPGVGEGLVYGTNRGDLHICQPSGIAEAKYEAAAEAELNSEHGSSDLRRNLFEMLGMNTPRTISIATQTVANNVRRSAATQTEQLNQSDSD